MQIENAPMHSHCSCGGHRNDVVPCVIYILVKVCKLFDRGREHHKIEEDKELNVVLRAAEDL